MILCLLMCVRDASVFLQTFLFFCWLILCKVPHVQLAFIYVPHFFWTPIWWTVYSREIINTDCHFWFRKRSVLRPLETDPTHELIVVYIYIRLSGPPKKQIRIILSPIFQVTLKKNMRMCRFQFTCRLMQMQLGLILCFPWSDKTLLGC